MSYELLLNKGNKSKKIYLYGYAERLFSILENYKYIERLSEINQLSIIKVSKKDIKTRKDYVYFQLYISDVLKDNLTNRLKYSLNNKLRLSEFNINSDEKISIGELVLMTIIIYNIGYSYNTIHASKGIVMISQDNYLIKNKLLSFFSDDVKVLLDKLIIENKYEQFHLIMGLVLLDKIDTRDVSIELAKKIIILLINGSDNEKINYVFYLYRKIRLVSYICLDLELAMSPFKIDLSKEHNVIRLLIEFFNEYNNQSNVKELLYSFNKMLNDIYYNPLNNVISYHNFANKISKEIININSREQFFNDWFKKDGLFNIKYHQHTNYDINNILKLTFKSGEDALFFKIYNRIKSTEFACIGYYKRINGDLTIAISLSKLCNNTRYASFVIFKRIINILNDSQFTNLIKDGENYKRLLLTTKYFLYYLFGNYELILTEHDESLKCVYISRGNKNKKETLSKILFSIDDLDKRHEVENMINFIDNKNDVSVLVPCSIQTINNNNFFCEFDGLIIHPNRKTDNIIFLEAKKTKRNASFGISCLCNKFNKLKMDFDRKQMIKNNHDVGYKYTVDK